MHKPEEEEQHFQSAGACVEQYQKIDSYLGNPASIDKVLLITRISSNEKKYGSKVSSSLKRKQAQKYIPSITLDIIEQIRQVYLLENVHTLEP